MATTYNTDIQKLYVAYFNRPADTAGLAYWESVVEANNGSTAAVSASFAASAEYKATYGSLSNSALVDTVYQNLFNRAADAAGKAYWVGLLDAGTVTIDAVVNDVSKAAVGTDMTSVNNKAAAAVAFTNALDLPSEQAGYDAASVSLAKAYIAGITTDATLAAATTPAALNATIGAVVTAGTPFTVSGALASVNAANAAMKTFLAGADGDGDSTTSATPADLTAAVTADTNDAAGLMTDGRDVTFLSGTSSTAVKAALIGDQTNAYAKMIAADQALVTKDAAAVDKVAGLTAAVAARDSATTADTTASKAVTAAAADLAAKVASYNVNHSAAADQITVDATTGVGTINGTDVFTVNSSGKLVLAAGVTESNHAGITAILTSSNAKEASDLALSNADKVLTDATNLVNHLDIDTSVGSTEVSTLATVQSTMGLSSSPTEAQITTYMTTLDTKAAATGASAADITAASDFHNQVNAYHAAAVTNPLVDALDTDTATLTTDTSNSTDFNAAVAALTADQALVDQYNGLLATSTAANAAFTKAGYNLVDLTATGASIAQVATTQSDVYVVGKVNTSINLFGLQGSDALSIGTGYTMVNGKLSTGDDTKLEVFVNQAANGTDTTIQIESHAFSSHVASVTAPELVTITLIGVNASHVHLDANGIITVA